MRIVICTDTFPPEINGVATSTLYMKRAFEAHGHAGFNNWTDELKGNNFFNRNNL